MRCHKTPKKVFTPEMLGIHFFRHFCPGAHIIVPIILPICANFKKSYLNFGRYQTLGWYKMTGMATLYWADDVTRAF